MKIGFFHVSADTESAKLNYLCAHALVCSARKVMPGVPVIMFTDTTTKAVKGIDGIARKPYEPMALLRMRHHAGVQGKWLFVDTDVVFQQDCRPIFRNYPDFEIGVTTRAWSHLKPAGGFSSRMPFNTGVVFSRQPHFWGEAYTRLRNMTPDLQQWMGDQEVIGEIVEEDPCRYAVRQLSGRKLNFPPIVNEDERSAKYEEQLAEAWIVHYKGPSRKKLLLDRMGAEGWA